MIQVSSKMKFRTCFSSISYYGYKLDILKSAMQKYLRRREKDKMIWCVAEIFLFQMLAKTDEEKRATKGIITNMLNRLIIMMDEELLFADANKYLVLRGLIENFEKSGRCEFVYLYKICDILVNARILRLNSDIRAFWDYRFRYDGHVYKNDDLKENDDDASFKSFVEEFNEKSPGCYYYMFKIFNGGRETKGVKWFKTKKENVYKIWNYLFNRKVVKENWMLRKALEYKLVEFHSKKRGERFMWLASAVQLVWHAKKLGLDVYMKEVEGSEIINRELAGVEKDKTEIMKEVFENRQKLVIDDYCIDQHCSQGRKMGKGKKDWKTIGSLVVDEDKEYFVKEWRDYYQGEWKNADTNVDKIQVKKDIVQECNTGKLTALKTREDIRNEKYKKAKKMRSKPNFNDIEKDLKKVDNIKVNEIKLCSDVTCGNKVMCFEYDGKIWKESRNSMNYNRDYCVIDECKTMFGLKTIGMERVIANFRIEKIDKSKKSWVDNWHKIEVKDHVVYCVMNKVCYYGIENPVEIKTIKKKFTKDRRQLKEFTKIGVFRGIFRCSDFNCRNVLVGCDGFNGLEYLVSIDEGDIGKRLDIIGKREKWLVQKLNEDRTIINEIVNELKQNEERISYIQNKMKEYKFNDVLINDVLKNWNNLVNDLKKEGIIFE